MDLLRDALQAFEGKDRLLSLLEEQNHSERSHLAEAILAVLEESRNQVRLGREDGSPKVLNEGEVLSRIDGVQFSHPRGAFDVLFCEDKFVLQPSGCGGNPIVVLYSAIEGIASVVVKGHDIWRATGLDEESMATPDFAQDQSYMFVNLREDASVTCQGSQIGSLEVKSMKSVSQGVGREHSSEVQSENEVVKLERLFRQRLPAETFDSVSNYRPQRGTCFFSPIYRNTAAFLFLMENSVCCAGEYPFRLSHSAIAAMGSEPTKATHFALKLFTDRDPVVHQLRYLPNDDKNTVLAYFKNKQIPTCAVDDLDTFRTINLVDFSQAEHAPLHANGHAPELRYPLRSIQDTDLSNQPALEDTYEQLDKTRNKRQRETISERFEDVSGDSQTPGTDTPDDMDLLYMLTGEDFPEQDDDDSDYHPIYSSIPTLRPTTKESHAAGDPGTEGCWIRKRNEMTDDDMELEELESEPSQHGPTD